MATLIFSKIRALGAVWLILLTTAWGQTTISGGVTLSGVLVCAPAGGQAATPTFSPSAGAVSNPTTVTASTATSGCGPYIYFDTNPTPTTNQTTYSVTTAVTLYAYVHGCPSYTDSTISSASYTISGGSTATPLLVPYIGATGNSALAEPSPVLAFGKQGRSTSSPAIPISISNPSNALTCTYFGIGCGSGSLTVSSMAISGTNASDFVLAGSCGAIVSGSDCEPTITFTPTAAVNTAETATLTVNYAGLSSQTMSLTGTSATVTTLSTSSGPTALSASTNYQVTVAITNAGTNFTFAGSGTEVNLNGYTLTYGNTSTASLVNSLQSSGFNTQLTLHNGILASGAGTNTFGAAHPESSVTGYSGTYGLSPSLLSGFFNLTFNSGIEFANAIENDDGMISVHDDIFDMAGVGTCATVGCRDELQAAAIYEENVSGVASGDTLFYENTQNGGPQGGFDAGAPGTVVAYNFINPGSATGNNTNDFAVWAWGNGAQIYDNAICYPLAAACNTRGIQVSAAAGGGSNVNIHNNIVEAYETPTNSEYGGCQTGGAYGLQYDDNPPGPNTANDNYVVAYAKACSGQALRLTDTETTTNLSENSTYTATRLSGATACVSGTWAEAEPGCAYALGLDGPLGATSLRDTFTGDNGDIFIGPDGAPGTSGGIIIQSPTFNKGSNPGSFWHFLVVQNGPGTALAVANVHVIDPTFGPGVSFTDDWIYAQGSNTGPASVYEDWTQTMTVTKASGPAAGSAVVTWTDTLSNTYTCTTNSSGICSVALTQYRDNNDTAANQYENRNPYSLSIPFAGCTTYVSSGITISATASHTITLSGC